MNEYETKGKDTYTQEEAFQSSLNYFNGDELAARVWVNKYALKDSYGNIFEKNPDDMHRRLAKEISRIENRYPNPLSEDTIFEVLRDFKYIVPQGGPMTGIGNEFQIASLSNCFVIGNEGPSDSYGGVMKIDHRRTFPKYAFGTFESWYKKVAQKQAAYPSQVSYFHGCYVNYNNPQLGKDLIKVMNAFGIGVQLLEKEKCCGVALISNGLIKQAQKQARTNINSIRKSVLEKKLPVIATSSTCTFTIRDEYPHLLDVDNADVRENVELATRYIYRLLSQKKTKLTFKTGKKIKVAFHTPCHMEKLGWAYYSIELLKLIPNVELTVLDSQCCGIAGTYGFKKENYKTSQDIGESLFKQIEALDIDYVVTDCETCKWQIEMSTSKRCEHPISILANALE